MRNASDALIVVDIQNDFCPGGALAVAGGNEIVARINAMMAEFSCVVLTQDWHPEGHSSFASQHPGAEPFSQVTMPYGPQTLWPDHCIQGSKGAEFHPDLAGNAGQLIVRKGFRREIDSYSAFFENDRSTATGLEGYLRARGVASVTLVGLATDFCVAFSALDAASLGFSVRVDMAACRAIDLGGSLALAQNRMLAAGVTLMGADEEWFRSS